jgi:hypothetical protein
MTIMRKIYPFTFLFILLVLGCENKPPDEWTKWIKDVTKKYTGRIIEVYED